jgi:hypothetical protein
MSLTVYCLLALSISLLGAHAFLIPKPIRGIPYNTFARYVPWGDMVSAGIYNWRTGEVFSWLSTQCLQHKSPIAQILFPAFSTTRPTLILADLPEIERIVTKQINEIDRADMMHTWFGLVVPRATIGLKTYDGHFRKQRRLWNVALSPKFLNEVAAQCFVGAANDLADVWMEKAELAGAGRAFEAQNDVKMATLDGMWMMCGGTSLGLMAARKKALQDFGAVEKKTDIKVSFAKVEMPKFYDILQTLLVCLDWVMQGFSPRVYTFIFRYTGFLGRAEREKDKILDACIALSRARVEKGVTGMTCALDEVIRKDLRLNDGSKTDIVDNPALRDELLELLITGHETTASSISWALKYLTDNPQAKNTLPPLCRTWTQS